MDDVNTSRVVLENPAHMEAWSVIEPVLAEYSQKLGVQIFASNPFGKATRPRHEPGKLFLRFCSSSNREAYMYHGDWLQYYDLPISKEQRFRVNAAERALVIYDDNCVSVAEVRPGTLYVLFNLPASPVNADTLMRKIMEDYLISPRLPPKELEAQLLKEAQNQIEQDRAFYIQARTNSSLGLKERMFSDRVELRQKIREEKQKLVDLIRRESQLRQNMSLDLLRGRNQDEAGLEFDQIRQLSGVVRVTAEADVISVYTEPIEILHKGRRREIGQFLIRIYPAGRNDCVLCYNLTRRSRDLGFNHPHIDDIGQCCFGNIQEVIPELIGQGQYAMLVTLILKYLRSYNEDDGLGLITDWPLKKAPRRD